MGAALECCESRRGSKGNAVDGTDAPIPLKVNIAASKVAETFERNPGDIEVALEDHSPTPGEQVLQLLGVYNELGKQNGRPMYRKLDGCIRISFQVDSWWMSTIADGFTVAVVESSEDKVPKTGWQTPKSLFWAPQDIPLVIKNVKAIEKADIALEDGESSAECCSSQREGCYSFLWHLVDRSPPQLKALLFKTRDKVIPSMRAKAETMCSTAKDMSVKDVKGALQNAHAQYYPAVRENMDKGARFARSKSRDLSESAKENLPIVQAKLGKGYGIAKTKSQELGAKLQEAHVKYGPVVKDKAQKVYEFASTTSTEEVKTMVRSKSNELLEKARTISLDDIKDLTSEQSETVKKFAIAKSNEFQEKGLPILKEKTMSCLEWCHAHCEPDEKQRRSSKASVLARPKNIPKLPLEQVRQVDEQAVPVPAVSAVSSSATSTARDPVTEQQTTGLKDIPELPKENQGQADEQAKLSSSSSSPPKKKGAAALLKGLRNGEVSKIVDKMEVDDAAKAEQERQAAQELERSALQERAAVAKEAGDVVAVKESAEVAEVVVQCAKDPS